MTVHSHEFVEAYEGFVGFGFDRETDENTVFYYLQKFSDDSLMRHIIPKMSADELQETFFLISRLLKSHLSEKEYHRLFLKEDHEQAAGCV